MTWGCFYCIRTTNSRQNALLRLCFLGCYESNVINYLLKCVTFSGVPLAAALHHSRNAMESDKRAFILDDRPILLVLQPLDAVGRTWLMPLNIQYVSSGSENIHAHVTCYVTVRAKYTACNYWPVERKHRLQRRLSIVVKAHSCSNTSVVCARTLLSPASLIQVNVPVSPLQLPIMQLSTPVPAEIQHLGGFFFHVPLSVVCYSFMFVSVVYFPKILCCIPLKAKVVSSGRTELEK